MKRRISSRSKAVDASGIRKVFDLAANLKRTVNLSIGLPHFDTLEAVKEAGIAAIREGFTRYTPTQGIPELRQAFRTSITKDKGREPEEVLVTSGVSGGILLAFLALLEPGDEVLVFDPYFVMYKQLARLVGAVPRFVDTYPDFRIRRETLRKAVTKKTRLIVLNSPCNPTGAVATAEEIRAVVEVAREFDLVLLSDEIYDGYVYGVPCPSPFAEYENTVLVGGLSKSAGMTGWRVGYAAGPADVVAEMTKLQQYTFVCAPSFAQKAALAAFTPEARSEMEKRGREYAGKRDIVYEGLKDRFRVVRPDGAFYVFPEAPRGRGEEFAAKAVENTVLVIPGGVFSEKATHFRISFAAADAVLREGVEILNRLAEKSGG